MYSFVNIIILFFAIFLSSAMKSADTFILVIYSYFVFETVILCDRDIRKRQTEPTCREVLEYACQSGQCIDVTTTCDGIQDCSDGSDETQVLCESTTCPYGFKCTYGACINIQGRCDGVTQCLDGSDEELCSSKITSESEVNPENISTESTTTEPTTAESTATESTTTESTTTASTTTPGKTTPWNTTAWKTTALTTTSSPDTKIKQTESINQSSIQKNAEDKFKCPNEVFIESSRVCDGRKDCSDGADETKASCDRYEYEIDITMDCGRVNAKHQGMIGKGMNKATVETTPWYVGIYGLNKTDSYYNLICGGSIIAPNLVISAAHCFGQYDAMRFKKISINDDLIKVSVGKYDRNFTVIEKNNFTQIINVKTIYHSDGYWGMINKHANDIAVIVLANKVSFSYGVTPVCVDWKSEYNVVNGALGKIVVWGEMKNGIQSALLEQFLPYINTSTCREMYLYSGFDVNVTYDKFCAGFKLGQGVSVEDSGAGITFLHSNSYFLSGILSFEDTVKNSSILGFTDINEHLQWILGLFNFKHVTGSPCVLPTVEGVVYSYEGFNDILSHGTLIKYLITVIENCEVGYHQAYPNSFRVCRENGKWLSNSEKLCFKMCPPLVSDSLDIKCSHNGNYANCSNLSIPDTIATPSCKPRYTAPIGQEDTPFELLCESDGTWNKQLYRCNPDCGRVYTLNQVLISNGEKTLFGTAPWNVGIYRLNKINSNYDFICGGSIISPNLVASAAHCFWKKGMIFNRISVNDGLYTIAVGKYARDFTVIDNDFTKIINVEIIYLKEGYYGPIGFHAEDIAIIVLQNRVSFNNGVAPVCIDWNGRYNVSNGDQGKIVGWGRTEKDISSPVLLEASLPFIDHRSCRDMYTNGFESFVTIDKFCAGSALGQGVGKGDSGAGLCFVHSNSYYLTGIVSIKDPHTNNSIAVFTEVKHHIQWIRGLFDKYDGRAKINSCVLPTVEGVVYSYEDSNETLSHGTLINHHVTVIEKCEVGYHKAYPYGLRFCHENGKWLSTADKLCFTAQNTDYKFLGCFLEENLLTLGEERRILNPVTPKSCSNFCSEKQYTFFFLKHDTCYCNKNYISILMRQLDFECSKKCSGDSSASCGGAPNLVSSYITDSSKASNFMGHGGYPIPIYLGCYTEPAHDDDDDDDDENRLLKGPAGPYTYNTPQKCSEICFKMGYLFFGVTYGTECWCGNQRPAKSAKVEDFNCDYPCSGDSKQFCGGGWRIGIYSTGITDYVPNKYIGCFNDDGKKTKGKYLSFSMDINNSPKRCMNLCNTHRFKYAAVKESSSKSVSESYIPIGCYTNLKRHPVLNGWRISYARLTPKHCVYSCHTRRFPYAALVSSKECLCTSTKPSFEAKTEDAMCTIPCSGSSQHTCGGNNAINVYTTGLEWKTDTIGNNYLGCYEESRNNRIFNGYSRSFTVNTPEFCSNLCYKFGYTYSGVTYKSECFCGSQSPSEPKFPRVEDKQCNTKCSGDANQFCGGGWRMGVFSTGLNDFPVEGQLLGCFVMQENTLNSIKFELINTNIPSKCSAICNNGGYQFSGVLGINCYCGNRAPESDQKVLKSDCDTPCAGDSSKTCGSEDRIQIYDLMKVISINIPNTNSSNDLVDEFDTLNLESIWSHDIYIAQEPDFEFVVYNNSEKNTFIKNRELVIKPTILPYNYVNNGSLVLKGCKKYEGSTGCSMNASSYYIIPPIVSSRLTTKNNMAFLYGKLEVTAKFPTGDWIVPEIALVSKTNEQNKFVLGTSFGNNDLKCNGEDESISVLKYGLKMDEQYHLKPVMMKSTLTNRWSDDYHTFVLSWSPENIVFKIDGESHTLDTSNLPLDLIFDSEYFISIGVSVGGMTNFRDGCLSNSHLKPWKNFDIKAMLNFWKDRNHWASTWNDEKSSLKVKRVKFTLLDNFKF